MNCPYKFGVENWGYLLGTSGAFIYVVLAILN